jgi:hypothetical protein
MNNLVKSHHPSTTWGSASYLIPSDFGIATETILGRTAQRISYACGQYAADSAATIVFFEKAFQAAQAVEATPIVSSTIRREAEVEKREKLIDYLSNMDTVGSTNAGDVGIDAPSRDAGICFLRSMSEYQIAPKLMEDGEGGIVFFWGNPAVLMVSVENDQLHTIVRPGSQDAVYVPTSRIVDGRAPSSIMRRVPSIEHAALLSL